MWCVKYITIIRNYYKAGVFVDIDRILNGLWKSLEKNTIITDSDGKAVYVSSSCERDPREVLDKIKVMPVEADEMEFFDLNIRINMTKIEDDGETYLCYTFTDISEYTSLVREISSYTKTLSSVAGFSGERYEQAEYVLRHVFAGAQRILRH